MRQIASLITESQNDVLVWETNRIRTPTQTNRIRTPSPKTVIVYCTTMIFS